MPEQDKPPAPDSQALSEHLRHNTRQRQAIVAYIEEMTGFALDEVPPQTQQRLALKWIERYAAQLRSEKP